MFLTKALVDDVQIAASTTTYYTAPEGTRTRITQCSITNNDSVARTFSINIVPSGGSASATNRLIYNKTLMPEESYVPYQILGAVLEPGSTLRAIASAAGQLSFYVSGIELTQ